MLLILFNARFCIVLLVSHIICLGEDLCSLSSLCNVCFERIHTWINLHLVTTSSFEPSEAVDTTNRQIHDAHAAKSDANPSPEHSAVGAHSEILSLPRQATSSCEWDSSLAVEDNSDLEEVEELEDTLLSLSFLLVVASACPKSRLSITEPGIKSEGAHSERRAHQICRRGGRKRL